MEASEIQAIRRTMLTQESIFKQQVHEMHTLYDRQRCLMAETARLRQQQQQQSLLMRDFFSEEPLEKPRQAKKQRTFDLEKLPDEAEEEDRGKEGEEHHRETTYGARTRPVDFLEQNLSAKPRMVVEMPLFPIPNRTCREQSELPLQQQQANEPMRNVERCNDDNLSSIGILSSSSEWWKWQQQAAVAAPHWLVQRLGATAAASSQRGSGVAMPCYYSLPAQQQQQPQRQQQELLKDIHCRALGQQVFQGTELFSSSVPEKQAGAFSLGHGLPLSYPKYNVNDGVLNMAPAQALNNLSSSSNNLLANTFFPEQVFGQRNAGGMDSLRLPPPWRATNTPSNNSLFRKPTWLPPPFMQPELEDAGTIRAPAVMPRECSRVCSSDASTVDRREDDVGDKAAAQVRMEEPKLRHRDEAQAGSTRFVGAAAKKQDVEPVSGAQRSGVVPKESNPAATVDTATCVGRDSIAGVASSGKVALPGEVVRAQATTSTAECGDCDMSVKDTATILLSLAPAKPPARAAPSSSRGSLQSDLKLFKSVVIMLRKGAGGSKKVVAKSCQREEGSRGGGVIVSPQKSWVWGGVTRRKRMPRQRSQVHV